MPIGSVSAVPHVMHALMQRRPRRVLDLGMGMGFYGVAVRQWLDLGVSREFRGEQTELYGVEGFTRYENPCWHLYDYILHGTIESAFRPEHIGEETFDAILLCDVIEHFERDEALELLPRIWGRVAPGGCLIVVTPAIWMEQGAVYGNELERHRSLWTADDFTSRGFSLLLDGTPDAFGCQMLAAMKQESDVPF